jgi:hypothetical protein
MQSYIPQWPGVMCIYGVTQVGSGSLGASRFLPALVLTLQWIKPVTVLLSGSWLVLYLLNRRTRTGLLAPRVLIMVGLVGVVAACDSAVEAAYLLIPKTEHFLSAGCCTASGRAPTIAGLVLERGIAGEGHGSLITGAYYVIHIGMVFVLAVCGLPSRLRGAAHWLWALLLGGLASLAAWVLFVVDVVAPLLLHERNHHCPYDLMAQAPASLVATAALAAASLTLSWTCVAAWFGQSAETGFWVERAVRRGLRISCCGYIVSVIVLSTRMALA